MLTIVLGRFMTPHISMRIAWIFFFFKDKREKENDSAYFTEIDLQNLVAYQIQKECDKSISSHILYKYIRSSEGDVVEVL